MTPLLRVEHVSKSFPGVNALDDVSLDVEAGEIAALLGHNGSGKSTLIKVLAGVYKADAGSVTVADGAGMHFIHQDLGLIPTLTTLENLDLSRPLGAGGLRPVARRAEHRRAVEMLDRFGAHFDVTVPVSRLTPAERSIVAIVRALDGWTSGRNILVLDEPTAALHGAEVSRLLDVVRQVADGGAAIVYVSHRLDEVMHLADRVVVLRDGREVADRRRGQFDQDDLVTIIAGRALTTPDPSGAMSAQVSTTETGEEKPVRLAVRGLTAKALTGIDLTVRSGEIVGVAGLVGSGMEHLASVIFGSSPRTAGTVEVDGVSLAAGSPDRAIRAGVGLVPSDRRRHGAVVTMTARENLTLPRIGDAHSSRRPGGLRSRIRDQVRLDHRRERADSEHWLATASVRPYDPERRFAFFSGGNQQKIVLAKWLRLDPAVLLLEEPTQGVDVGAKAGIYDLLARAAAAGAAVLVASSDVKELAAISDRVVVLDLGVVVSELARPHLSEQRLLEAVLTGAMPVPSPTGALR